MDEGIAERICCAGMVRVPCGPEHAAAGTDQDTDGPGYEVIPHQTPESGTYLVRGISLCGVMFLLRYTSSGLAISPNLLRYQWAEVFVYLCALDGSHLRQGCQLQDSGYT